MDQSEKDNPAYPLKLKAIEYNLLRKRRRLNPETQNPHSNQDLGNVIGFGLSGGGIRSATFCLGIFQGLAKQQVPQASPASPASPDNPPKTLLSKIDYMSTVSGGGFFGAFYGRLFTRKEIAEFTDVEDIFRDSAACDEERRAPGEQKFPRGKIFRWLRENGRYLAPHGTGDVLLAGAAVVRNLIAVQLVLTTFVLIIFLAAQLVRGVVEVIAARGPGFGVLWSGYQRVLVGDHFWWSPYAALPAAAFLFLAVPPGWAYWLVERPNRETAGNWIPPVWGQFAIGIFSLAGMALAGLYDDQPLLGAFLLLLLLAIETLLWAALSGWRPAFAQALESEEASEIDISENERLRLRLSRQLKTALITAAVLLTFVVIDSLAQTAYAVALLGQHQLKLWAVAAFAPIIGLGGFARSIVALFGNESGGRRFSVPLKLIAGIVADVVTALVLTGPRPVWTTSHKLIDADQLAVINKEGGGSTITSPAEPSSQNAGDKARLSQYPSQPGTRRHFCDLIVPAFALLIALVMSFLFGWSWPFLNRSTHRPIYTSRLIRAYLGASNPERLKPPGVSVTDAILGDDISQENYWPRHRWLRFALGSKLNNETNEVLSDKAKSINEVEGGFFKKGAPLHLVNVTINETLDAQSEVEQRDRKGVGMAVGPAAISVGVLHHLVLGDPTESPSATPFTVYPSAEPDDTEAYQIFRYRDRFDGEFLSLGSWTGISGAAFSTSLGWRTSLAFSLLAGLANIRLSYWWNSGVQALDLLQKKRQMVGLAPKLVDRVAPEFRRRLAVDAAAPSPLAVKTRKTQLRQWSSALFRLLFSVQGFLFDELFARFHGTAAQWWPLSDGGHFENMGGYELVRRRLQTIVIVDAEADSDYTFEGLSNLVRKARLDFGAEIRFLTEEELDVRVHSGVRRFFGTLEQLRRGNWIEEPVEDPNAPKLENVMDKDPETPLHNEAVLNAATRKRKRLSTSPVDENALSLAHAALAEVIYADERAKDGSPSAIKHLLLYIKPSLIGDEPADVRRYHTENPSFPHESTLEQFFDEAQWESYRRLGEHIADKIFRSRDDKGNLFTPEANCFFPYLFTTAGDLEA
jgi:hypothetical protein